jgi:tetratricopeptide (TPR) repeat protein
MSQSDTNREGLLDRVKAQSKKPRRRLGKVLLALFVGILLVAVIGFFTLPGSGLGLKLGITKKTDYERMMEFVAQGRKAYQKRDYDRALRFFQEAEKVLGTVEEPYRMQAMCLYQQGPAKLDEAIQLLEKAILVEPRLDQARFELARICLENRMPERTLEIVADVEGSTRQMPLAMMALGQQAASMLRPRDLDKEIHYGEMRVQTDGRRELPPPEPCLTLAESYLARHWTRGKDTDLVRASDLLVSAERRGNAILDREDDNHAVRRILALVKMQMVRVAAAKNIPEKRLDEIRGEALALIEPAIAGRRRADEEVPRGWITLHAEVLHGLGRVVDALDLLAEERRLNPSVEAYTDDVELRLLWARSSESEGVTLLHGAEEVLAEGMKAFPEDAPRFRYSLARVKDALGEAEEAERILLEAARQAEEEGRDPEVWRLILAERRRAAGDVEEAEKQYLQILERDETNLQAHRVLVDIAGTRLLRRRGEAARVHRGTLDARLAAARAHYPEDAVVLYWEGMVQFISGRLTLAEETFQRLLSVEPRYIEAHLARGQALQMLGDLDGAITAYRTYLVEEAKNLQVPGQPPRPPSERAQFALLNAYLAAGRFGAAALLGRKAVDQHADSVRLRFTFGEALLLNGEGGRAKEQFEIILEKQPDWGPAHIGRGRALWMLNRRPAAKQAFDAGMLTDDRLEIRKIVADFYVEQGKWDYALAEHKRIVERFGDDPRAYLLLGHYHDLRMEIDAARDAYRQGLELDPANLRLWAELGDTYITLREPTAQDLQEARTCANEILQREPRHPLGRLVLAGTLYRQRDLKAATEILRQNLDDYPDDRSSRLLLARILFEQPEPDLAAVRDHLTQLLRRRPDDPKANMLLSRVALLEGMDEARRNAPDSLEKANERFLEAVQRNMDDPEARLALADTFLRLSAGDPAKLGVALAESRKLIEDKPEHYAGYLLRGTLESRRAAAEKDLAARQRALRDLERAREKAPEYFGTHLALAIHHDRHGDHEKAFESFAEVLRLVPGHLGALQGAALSLAAQEKRDEAASLLRATLAEHPNLKGYGSYLLGFVLEGADKPAEAREAYRAALAVSPKFELAAARLIANLRKAGEQEKLDALIRRLVAEVPESARYQTELGQILLREGRPARAREIFETAIRAASEQGRTYLAAYGGLLGAYRAEGKVDAAVERFEQLVKADAGNAFLRFLLGSLEESRGRLELAKGHYGQALELQPKLHAAANNLAWILAWHDAGQVETKEDETRLLEEALVLAEQARQGMRDSAQVMDTLAWIYIRLRRFEQALALLEDAESSLRDDVMYQLHRALALDGVGRTGQARDWLGRAEQGLASYPLADDRLRRELREARLKIQ